LSFAERCQGYTDCRSQSVAKVYRLLFAELPWVLVYSLLFAGRCQGSFSVAPERMRAPDRGEAIFADMFCRHTEQSLGRLWEISHSETPRPPLWRRGTASALFAGTSDTSGTSKKAVEVG
jgi:hypothetical protein